MLHFWARMMNKHLTKIQHMEWSVRDGKKWGDGLGTMSC